MFITIICHTTIISTPIHKAGRFVAERKIQLVYSILTIHEIFHRISEIISSILSIKSWLS